MKSTEGGKDICEKEGRLARQGKLYLGLGINQNELHEENFKEAYLFIETILPLVLYWNCQNTMIVKQKWVHLSFLHEVLLPQINEMIFN